MVYVPALERGYQQMYNLNFNAAHQTFRDYQHVQPDDPMGYASVAGTQRAVRAPVFVTFPTA